MIPFGRMHDTLLESLTRNHAGKFLGRAQFPGVETVGDWWTLEARYPELVGELRGGWAHPHPHEWFLGLAERMDRLEAVEKCDERPDWLTQFREELGVSRQQRMLREGLAEARSG